MRFYRLITIVFLLVFANAGGMAADTLSGVLKTDAQEAVQLFEVGDWRNLENVAHRWVDRDGANWRSWYYLGTAQSKLNKDQEALQSLQTSLRISPEQPTELLRTIADLQVRVEDWVAAEYSYRLLLAEDDKNAEIWEILLDIIGRQDSQSKQQEEANILEKMLNLAEYINNVDYWHRYANLLESLEQLAKTREAYQHVLRLRPDDLKVAEWVFHYDESIGNEGMFEKSQKHLLALNPNHPEIFVNFAEEALRRGDKKLAYQHYGVAAKGGGYPRAQAIAMTGLARLGNPSDRNAAFSYYSEAIRIDPQYLPAWEGAIVVLRAQHYYDRADLYFSRMQIVRRRIAEGRAITNDILRGL